MRYAVLTHAIRGHSSRVMSAAQNSVTLFTGHFFQERNKYVPLSLYLHNLGQSLVEDLNTGKCPIVTSHNTGNGVHTSPYLDIKLSSH